VAVCLLRRSFRARSRFRRTTTARRRRGRTVALSMGFWLSSPPIMLSVPLANVIGVVQPLALKIVPYPGCRLEQYGLALYQP
jgi:hypothetical protein